MNALDCPLEALPFNYLTFGFSTIVNNIWTWIAVVTLAVSFWTIRAASLPKSEEPRSRNPDVSPSKVVLPPPPVAVAEPASASTSGPSKTMTPSICAVGSDGETKGKFTVYYEDDREVDEGELDHEGDLGSGAAVVGGDWYEGWDRVLRMRTGEMGWYSFQDMTALDGNVVRLWDGCRRKSAVSGSVMW